MAAGSQSFRACQQRSCGGNRSAQTELECLRVRLGEAERGLSERRLEADEVRTRHHIPHTVDDRIVSTCCNPRLELNWLDLTRLGAVLWLGLWQDAVDAIMLEAQCVSSPCTLPLSA